jgi:hypothetical protein
VTSVFNRYGATVLAETYLFYSSLTLFAMSCSTLVLSILFRLKHHKMSSLPRNLSADVFNKTFNVFDPYSEHRKTIHSFLSALPLIIVLASLVFILLALRVLESGLLLSLFLLIIYLNLMLVEAASETYQNAKIFIKAINNKADLGVGDLKAFQTLKRVIPKLSNYYLALSILFLTLAATLGYIWSSLLWFFARVVGLILEVYALSGSAIYFQVAVLLFALMVGVVQIFIHKIRSKFLSHLLGT